MSPTRKRYFFRLVCRCIVLILCGGLSVVHPEEFEILEGMNFFRRLSVLHLLWLVWVLIWCPFRLMLKNRCCTTCRIFNCDHLMSFSPLIFMGGFYGISLVVLAVLAWLVWELCIMMYPERFWHQTNLALKCSECTDKLCTQYCQKLRK